MVVWYSEDNTISGNSGTGGRYSMHFMYSKYNLVERNRFWNNSVGIYVMYSDGVDAARQLHRARHGRDRHGARPQGELRGQGRAQPDHVLRLGHQHRPSPYRARHDRRVHRQRHRLQRRRHRVQRPGAHRQRLQGQHRQGQPDLAGRAQPRLGDQSRPSSGNYWDDYEGFDRDRDGIGDTPYEVHAYADRLLDGRAAGAVLQGLADARVPRLPRAPGALQPTRTSSCATRSRACPKRPPCERATPRPESRRSPS